MTDSDLIAKMQLMEVDHTPDGYPTVTMGEISRLVKMCTDYRATIQTFLHDLDAHNEDEAKNGPILMDSMMWMQVQAFRNMLEDK